MNDVLERHTESKKVEKRYFPQPLGKLISSPGSKNTLKTRETYFLHRNPQKPKDCRKTFEICFWNKFSKTSLNSLRHTVPEKKRKLASYACKRLWFVLKNEVVCEKSRIVPKQFQWRTYFSNIETVFG